MKKNIKIYYNTVYPSSRERSEFFAAIGLGVDAVIIECYASGAVPVTGKGSVLPVIEAANKKNIPVFLTFGSAEGLPAFTEWTDFKERVMPGIYETQAKAIALGAVPLERDSTQKNEVVAEMEKIFKNVSGYKRRIKAVREHFNSQEFDKRIDYVVRYMKKR
ncbi:MAG: hypothetical protein ABIF92_02795 [archaeon]